MRLKNILIAVKDIKQSKQFYHDLFGLDTILDNDGNVILTEGLVLQDAKIWKEVLNDNGGQERWEFNQLTQKMISLHIVTIHSY